MRYLRTNTATRVTVGPFLDKTDGITPETALTVTNCKLTMTVDDGGVPTLVLDTAPAASGSANDMVHITGDDAGFYDLEIAAANVNYVGRAMLALTDAANHCPVFHEFQILPAVVYDAMILGTDLFDVSVTQILGTAVSTPATAGILDVNLKNIANAAVSTSSAQLGVNVVQAAGTAWGSGAITAASIASDAITDAKVASDVTIASVTGAVGSVTGAVGSVTGAVGSIASGGISEASFATTAGSFNPLGVIDQGTAQGATASTLQLRAGASFADNDIKDAVIVIVSASTGAGQSKFIESYAGATDTATVSTWNTTPTGTIVYKVYASPAAAAAALAAIADAVCDEALSGHSTAGTLGKAISDIDTHTDTETGAAAIRAAVGLASANLDTQLADLPTNAELDTALAAADDAVLSAVAGVQSDTNDIQTRLPAALVSGRMDSSVGAMAANVLTATAIAADAITDAKVASDVTIASITGNVGGNVTGTIGSLAAQAKADINAEVVDALATDTYAEPGQGAPAATTSLAAKLNYLYKWMRNKKDNDGTVTNFYADNGTTIDQKQTVSESGGTVTKGEIGTGA